jgi:hypothetical protein
LRVLDQVQVQGFRLTQHCLNTIFPPEDGHTTETYSSNWIKY